MDTVADEIETKQRAERRQIIEDAEFVYRSLTSHKGWGEVYVADQSDGAGLPRRDHCAHSSRVLRAARSRSSPKVSSAGCRSRRSAPATKIS